MDALNAPLTGKTALVTGAAGAIGCGICRGLLANGCRVAATDISPKALDGVVAELQGGGRDRISGVIMDVSDESSVAAGFSRVIDAWGRMDIVIVNAGIAMVAPILEMDLEAFRRVQRVNVDGALLTLREAGRRMIALKTGGDIVLVSTKNVFMPGASFGAYSATKAAAHQLARIASQEFAPHDIRVNMVAPDAVFGDEKHKSGLWAEVGPSRMKARGLDEKGLEEYYRSRNLLKAKVTAEHVANAILFFVTRQTPTTGATIPVDGGLPDSTPR
jgi:NAD(P)-dependent dehydrogenase (short-subunit alcohol dehydrogenase family)